MTISPQQEVAILALASGACSAKAARRCGVSARTVQRWQTDPAFSQAVRDLRKSITEKTAARLTALSVRAVNKLGRLINSDNERTAYQAVKATLELSMRSNEQTTQEEIIERQKRIEELLVEANLDGKKTRR
jgi:hypothetical protein